MKKEVQTRLARIEEALRARHEADAARFIWWFSMPARANRPLDEWRTTIDKAMQAEKGTGEPRLIRQLRASIEAYKTKDRARRT